jgi:hypothetical protein
MFRYNLCAVGNGLLAMGLTVLAIACVAQVYELVTGLTIYIRF